MRAGLLLKKIGMSSIYKEDGTIIPVTLLELPKTTVISHKVSSKHGYNALQLAVGEKKEKNIKKPQLCVFKKLNISPPEKLVEFRVDENNFIDLNSSLEINHFKLGQLVDVTSTSKGKGFAGVIKRHNFRSLRATHGVSLTHRSHGSTGQRQDPGKVFKGKKMAGHLGNATTTTQNLEVVYINEEKKIIALKGSVPGAKNGFVKIKDAVKAKSL